MKQERSLVENAEEKHILTDKEAQLIAELYEEEEKCNESIPLVYHANSGIDKNEIAYYVPAGKENEILKVNVEYPVEIIENSLVESNNEDKTLSDDTKSTALIDESDNKKDEKLFDGGKSASIIGKSGIKKDEKSFSEFKSTSIIYESNNEDRTSSDDFKSAPIINEPDIKKDERLFDEFKSSSTIDESDIKKKEKPEGNLFLDYESNSSEYKHKNGVSRPIYKIKFENKQNLNTKKDFIKAQPLDINKAVSNKDLSLKREEVDNSQSFLEKPVSNKALSLKAEEFHNSESFLELKNLNNESGDRFILNINPIKSQKNNNKRIKMTYKCMKELKRKMKSGLKINIHAIESKKTNEPPEIVVCEDTGSEEVPIILEDLDKIEKEISSEKSDDLAKKENNKKYPQESNSIHSNTTEPMKRYVLNQNIGLININSVVDFNDFKTRDLCDRVKKRTSLGYYQNIYVKVKNNILIFYSSKAHERGFLDIDRTDIFIDPDNRDMYYKMKYSVELNHSKMFLNPSEPQSKCCSMFCKSLSEEESFIDISEMKVQHVTKEGKKYIVQMHSAENDLITVKSSHLELVFIEEGKRYLFRAISIESFLKWILVYQLRKNQMIYTLK